MYIGLGIFLLVVGAILYFAVGATMLGPISLSMVGIICNAELRELHQQRG